MPSIACTRIRIRSCPWPEHSLPLWRILGCFWPQHLTQATTATVAAAAAAAASGTEKGFCDNFVIRYSFCALPPARFVLARNVLTPHKSWQFPRILLSKSKFIWQCIRFWQFSCSKEAKNKIKMEKKEQRRTKCQALRERAWLVGRQFFCD